MQTIEDDRPTDVDIDRLLRRICEEADSRYRDEFAPLQYFRASDLAPAPPSGRQTLVFYSLRG